MFLLISACGNAHSPTEPGADATVDAAANVDSSVDGNTFRDSMATDAATDSTAMIGDGAIPDGNLLDGSPRTDGGDPRMGRRPVTETQAACLGLDQPACAGCHQINGKFFLEIIGGPPPPPDAVPGNTLEECGVMRMP